MSRLVLVLALLVPLSTATAKSKKPEVEIWPPPAPGTDQAGEKSKPDKPKAAEKPPEPSPADDPPPERTEPEKPKAAADEDPCEDPFDDCQEDCTLEHATDDSLHVAKGKKLPIVKCVARCQKAYDACEERREAGFDTDPAETRHDAQHGD